MFRAKKIQHGFSLIEVLISLLVLGVGMLGLGGLQVAAVKGSEAAHERKVANQLIMSLTDRMRANPVGSAAGFYEKTIVCTSTKVCRGASSCSPEELAEFDLLEINCGAKRGTKREGGVLNSLLAGDLAVKFNPGACTMSNIPYNTALYRVELEWGERNLHKNQSGTGDMQTQKVTVCVNP